MRMIPALLLVFACKALPNGTSIGNPNKTIIKVAPPGDEVQLQQATLKLQGVFASGTAIDPPESDDVLAGLEIELPRNATSVRLEIEGTFDLLGMDGENVVDLQLDVQQVQVVALDRLVAEPSPLVFELAYPGWLDASEVGWSRGEDHVVRPGGPNHLVLVDAVRLSSSLLQDADDDGEPDR